MPNIAHYAWRTLVNTIYNHGDEVAPRGMATRELLGFKSEIDMNFPVIVNKARKLGYKFMCAEAAWILSGDNRVSTIKPYSKEIEKFSDDGYHFFGAYGPKFRDQVRHVIDALANDPSSRQAVMTLWRPNPPKTKDVPCTISLSWTVRGNKLHCFANMRSSDVWLGVPYDWFNFSMMSGYVALLLKEICGAEYDLGSLHFYAQSQHLYEKDFLNASNLINTAQEMAFEPPEFKWREFESADKLISHLWACANLDPDLEEAYFMSGAQRNRAS